MVATCKIMGLLILCYLLSAVITVQGQGMYIAIHVQIYTNAVMIYDCPIENHTSKFATSMLL